MIKMIKIIERRRSNNSRSKLLMAPHPSTNFEIQKYYQNELNFHGGYSRNLFTTKDEVYMINLDEYESTGTHWIGIYVNP